MNIETVEDKKSTSTTDIPWHFLRLLMEANSNARKQDTSENGTSEDDFNSSSQSPNATAMSFHPLDLISAIFVCADTILQQELILRMSLCQFAFPIVMLSPEGRPTFLMHPMRSFVRRYRPQSMRDRAGYIEECMATSSLPTFAFVRFGNCSSSKSKLLNQVFSSQPNLDYFVHSNMRCGDISRKVSDGMIEMIWYLPSGSKDIDIIPEAVAVMNLRGDAQNFPEHVQFLSKVATTLFVFIEHLNEQAETFLFSNPQIQQKRFLIINSKVGQIYLHLERLVEAKLIAKDHILTKYRKNKEDFLQSIRSKLIEILRKGAEVKEKALSLQAMLPAARASKFLIDEDNNVISEAWGKSERILQEIVSEGIKMIRERELYFQGDTWEKISGIDKEMCQLKSLSDANVSDYVSQLQREREDLCRALACRGMSNLMRQIIVGLQTMGNQRKLFLNCLRNALESNSVTVSHSNIMLNLETEEQVESQSIQEQLTEHNKNLLDKSQSLGLEHFLREMGLIYEVFQIQPSVPSDIKQFPSLAADMMLEGFPIELMDGDVSNIPMEWVTSVLTEVDKKVKPCRIFVLSVLGLQSTGKSTLLNGMFGCQFAVGCGRCTSGVYMQLIRTTGTMKEKACD
ncbi:up-regulator of cell proliferation-like, partial [Chiloscyllium plagiosum]|uniref:up-regulator of cell proliferation-like n=1 Tax=Chiloscyllium plagiosum TaxID=36176 RepID=UPI001CB7F13C